MLVTTDNWKLQALTLKRAWFSTTTLSIGLSKAPWTPSRFNILSDFTQPSIFISPLVTGVINFGPPYINAAGFAQMDNAALAQWVPAGITAGESIYGYFVYWPAMGKILWSELNPGGPALYGTTLLPYILQATFSDSQFFPTGP